MVVKKSKGNGTPAISGKPRLVKYYSIWPDDVVGDGRKEKPTLNTYRIHN